MKTIIFLCTGNSARSIMSEFAASDERFGLGKLRGLSAGSQPTGKPNPFALETLERHGISHEGAASKSWDVFTGDAAESIDYIVTVCGNAANETCPIWPGRRSTAHWGVPDPAAVEGSDDDKRAAFEAAFLTLTARIRAFAELPLNVLNEDEVRARAAEIADIVPPGGSS